MLADNVYDPIKVAVLNVSMCLLANKDCVIENKNVRFNPFINMTN